MGALVTLPHHYMGFIYIGLYFGFYIIVPWLNERHSDSWDNADGGDKNNAISTRWDTLQCTVFLVFFFISIYSCSFVPTGKYFISLGSMDGIVFSYWYLILYFILVVRVAFVT